MFINNFYKRVILLALEFFEVTVMRRPDHKFRDQWRKAESALQPPSSSAFFFILWPHFLCAFCFLAFHCKNDPLLLNFSHIYLVLPSLQIVSLCFPSVFTIASFFYPRTDCGPLHLSFRISSLVSQLERKSFLSKAQLGDEKYQQAILNPEKRRRREVHNNLCLN